MESPAIRGLWNEVKDNIPGVEYGGSYAIKPGYHNTRLWNEQFRPNDYSIQLTADRIGPDDLSSAIDLTMSTSEMIKRTGYLRNAALNPNDSRTSYIREFIGTLNGVDVYCLEASGPGTAFHFDGDRDDSHLWHIHLSIYRMYCNDPQAMSAILSVLKGETFEQWIGNSDMTTVDDIHRLLHDGTRAPGQANTSGGGVPIAWIVRRLWEHDGKFDMILANLATLAGVDFVNEEQIISGVLSGLGSRDVEDIVTVLRATVPPDKLAALKEAL